MKEIIPKEIRLRKSKWGFETPQQQWLNGALRPTVQRWSNESKPLDDVVEPVQTRALIDDFLHDGKLEDAQMLLRLFLLDQWFRTFDIKV